jgi:hypothetical protein
MEKTTWNDVSALIVVSFRLAQYFTRHGLQFIVDENFSFSRRLMGMMGEKRNGYHRPSEQR